MALEEVESKQLVSLFEKMGLSGAKELTTKEQVENFVLAMKRVDSADKGASKDVDTDDTKDGDADSKKSGNTVPKLTWFSGEIPPPKGYASYDMWKFEVQGLDAIYKESVIIQAVRRSLKGGAADVVRCLGYEADLSNIMDTLETRYGVIEESADLMQELLSARQADKEKAVDFGARLELICYKLKQTTGECDDSLVIQQFFRGLRDDRIREVLRPNLPMYSSLNEAIKKVRSLESEYTMRLTWQASKVKVNSVSAEAENTSLDKAWLQEQFKSMKESITADVIGKVKEEVVGLQYMGASYKPRGGFRGGRFFRGGYKNKGSRYQHSSEQKQPFNPEDIVCHNCEGKGHYARGCALPRKKQSNYRGSASRGRR